MIFFPFEIEVLHSRRFISCFTDRFREKLMKHAVNLWINLVALIETWRFFFSFLKKGKKTFFISPHMILFTELHNVLFVSDFFLFLPCLSGNPNDV